ncbi:unnamed protein product [Ectocarpus sp. 8 AP-2014]
MKTKRAASQVSPPSRTFTNPLSTKSLAITTDPAWWNKSTRSLAQQNVQRLCPHMHGKKRDSKHTKNKSEAPRRALNKTHYAATTAICTRGKNPIPQKTHILLFPEKTKC